MKEKKDLFPRRCDVTGKGMREGYCFNDGGAYACDEDSAKSYVESLGHNWGEELETIGTDEEWFYWTEWEDELDTDELVYDERGFAYTFFEGEWVIFEGEWEYEDTKELPGCDTFTHIPTKKTYEIPTEIVRFFDQATLKS